MATILIIDDEETLLKNAARYLEKFGHTVECATTGQSGLTLFAQCSPDALVLDYRLPDQDGLALIEAVRALDSHVPIIMITGHGSIDLAVQAMKAGANDLLTKPLALSELRSRIDALTQRLRDSSRLQYFESRERESLNALVGDSVVMHNLRSRIERVANSASETSAPPILITGETGTGKELVARACHFGGPRSGQPFVELNCAAIPLTLLESELFGHERGAFTDARERKLGMLEAAEGGTLFLDEIGEMDLTLQAKLLKVIEDQRFRRIGSVHERQVNLRIVAATNQDLQQRIQAGAFRADLYFRLRVLQLEVPALRQRPGDAVRLAEHFLALLARQYRKPHLQLSERCRQAIANHTWPGNVRELRNVLEQAVLLCETATIEVEDLALGPNVRVNWESLAEPSPAGSTLDRMERDALIRALQGADFNVSRAARALGISRDTLRYRMEKHRLNQNPS